MQAPKLDRKSSMLSKAALWSADGRRLGTTEVTDEIDYIVYGGAHFRRGEWSESERAYLFVQCETPIVLTTDHLNP